CVGLKAPQCIPGGGGGANSEYEMTADAPLFVRLPVRAGPREIQVAFTRNDVATRGAGPTRVPHGVSFERAYAMAVEGLEVEGPFNVTGLGDTPSRRKVFVCRPTVPTTEEPCANKILAALARKAYRRPVVPQDLQGLMRLYRAARSRGTFDMGIQAALE